MSAQQSGSSFGDFQTHVTPIPARGMAQRAPAGMRVFTTGRIETNLEAGEWLLRAAREAFGDVTKCGILWASNEETRTVAGKLVHPETIGVTLIRKSVRIGILWLYMHNVFIEQPGLKPSQTSWVSMTPRDDAPAPWFTVHLNLALATVRSKGPYKSPTLSD
jgi:hypothetical protein